SLSFSHSLSLTDLHEGCTALSPAVLRSGVFMIMCKTLCSLWTLSLCRTRQFHVVKERKTWANAQRYCREEFTDLATIENQEEMDDIKSALNGANGKFWIGLKQKRTLTTRSWIWSDGSDSSYSNWIPGEPNNYNIFHNCVELRSENTYQWNDAGCYHKNKFICYKGE
uniref:C-type lectin domain-containing protein n=1 Tax=Astyanax mexicanus TaxID=7994 RepID=A0A8B9HYC2_ASTMX